MILVHFDVLALPSETLITRQPSPEGRRLWNTLWDYYQGRIVLTVSENTDVSVLAEWLKKEGYKPSVIHPAPDFHRSESTPRADAIWQVHSSMGSVEWYIDTDADTCARAVRMGIPTLLVAIPVFQRPEWHEPEGFRGWDVVVSELEAQAIKKSERNWRDL